MLYQGSIGAQLHNPRRLLQVRRSQHEGTIGSQRATPNPRDHLDALEAQRSKHSLQAPRTNQHATSNCRP